MTQDRAAPLALSALPRHRWAKPPMTDFTILSGRLLIAGETQQ
jgi:hypothetical protein